MRQTRHNITTEHTLTVSTIELMRLLNCGRASAVRIGTAAGAKVQNGRLVFWYLPKVRRYLEQAVE